MRLGKCVMRDQKGSLFFFDEQHMQALFCVKRACSELLRWTHVHPHALLQEAHTTDLISMGGIAPQSAVLAVVMRHIAAQSVQSSREREKEGRGKKKCNPPVFPLSRLASVPQQAVVRRGSFYMTRGCRSTLKSIGWATLTKNKSKLIAFEALQHMKWCSWQAFKIVILLCSLDKNRCIREKGFLC